MKIKTVEFCRGLRDKVHEELKEKPFSEQKDILAKGVEEAGMKSKMVSLEIGVLSRKVH